jgi:phosphoribosylglycinamide formyltransferase 2
MSRIHFSRILFFIASVSFYTNMPCVHRCGIIGTPLSATATKVLLLGSGELGKELAIELQRLGVEVVAVDRYENAPAMHVAHGSYVISMLDCDALRAIIEQEKPDYIVPEIEAIATDVLLALEKEGYTVIPTARAVQLTMNREDIRRLAAEDLGLKTSRYLFAQTYNDYCDALHVLGFPCVVKPIMSSSGKGQSIISCEQEIEKGWCSAQEEARGAKSSTVIIEEFIDFDYEITLLTVRSSYGTRCCLPIGHKHCNGEYVESWQPHAMDAALLQRAQKIAHTITDALGGHGVFGVELFIKGDEIYFSEVSPRPHDTGMVTLISQNLSEFALHARAILGLPIPLITHYGPAASCVLLVDGHSDKIRFGNIAQALMQPDTQLYLFGKPSVNGHRRMGVAVARGSTVQEAQEKARAVINAVGVELQ